MNRDKINDLLKKVNSKSKKKWNLADIKSLARNYSKNDLKNEDKMKDLITKVAKATGVKLTDEKLNQVKNKISKFKLF
jgi:uncharacterized protein YpuA (DUF1002 family)